MPGHYDKGIGTAVQRRIPLAALTTDVAGNHVVQGSLDLSKMNNRLYRQCRNYEFQFQFTPLTGEDTTQRVAFYTLPDTWFVRGAIAHAYETYMLSMADELNAGIKMAKWHDFNINEQDPDAVWDYMAPVLFDGNGWADISADETITDSSVTNTSGTSIGFNIMGAESNSYNIFSEFAKKLNYSVPDSEVVSSDQPYDGLLDLDDADVLAERGDRAPYDRDFSGWLHDGTDDQNILVLQDSLHMDLNAAGGRMTTRRFTAPLGLVWVQKWENGSLVDLSDSEPELLMIASPGSYKGVKAPSLV